MSLPEKKILIVIILASLIMPLQYALWVFYPPEGTVFNGYDEGEAVYYSAMNSYKRSFENPWILDNEPVPKLIFFMPFLGSVYILAFLGVIVSIFGIQPLLIYVFFRVAATVLFLMVSYYLIGYLIQNKKYHNRAFFIFLFSAGLMGVLQIHKIFNVTDLSLFGMGVGPYRIIGYYTALSAALGLASILFTIRNKPLIAGFLIGLATLVYPMHGFASFIIASAYILLNYNNNKIKNIIKAALPAIPFGLAWILPYIIDNTFFIQYFNQNSVGSIVFSPSVMLGIGPGIVFVLYELYHRLKLNDIEINKRICFIIAIISSFILFSLAYVSQPSISVINPGFPATAEKYGFSWVLRVASDYSIVFEMPFIIIILKFLSDSIAFKENKDHKFVLIWFLLMTVLTFTPTKYTGMFPDKYLIFFYVPALILSANGALRFSANHKLDIKKIILLIIILSLPSILLINAYTQMLPRERYYHNSSESTEFYSKSEHNALLFLKSRPYGVALSSERISLYLPYYTDKKSLLFSDDRFAYKEDEKRQGYEGFYLDPNSQFLEKYNITYVFYDRFEKQRFSTNLGNSDFLENIYNDNVTEIYSVKY